MTVSILNVEKKKKQKMLRTLPLLLLTAIFSIDI